MYKINTEKISSSAIADAYFLMSENRQRYCDGLKNEQDKIRCILADQLARRVLSLETGLSPENIIFSKDENEKPYLVNSEYHFNVSHSGKYVVLAVNKEREVGIDIEKIRSVRSGMLLRVCSDEELSFVLGKDIIPTGVIDDVDMLRRFFCIWTYKEAFLKCIGTGIRDDLKTVKYDKSNCFYCDIDDYCLSVVTDTNL